MEAAGKRRWKPSLLGLLELLRLNSVNQLEEVCIALGNIGDDQAVEPLFRLLKNKSAVLGLGRGTPETVRVRAAWALAQTHTPLALDRLSQFRDDPEPQVRQIVAEASPPPSSPNLSQAA